MLNAVLIVRGKGLTNCNLESLEKRQYLLFLQCNKTMLMNEIIQGIQKGMRLIEKGTFIMGDRGQIYSPSFWESLQGLTTINTTLVELTSDFYISDHTVTCEEWNAVMGTQIDGMKKPMVNVSWHEANAFIAKLNEITGQVYRLPTEAEWEFAARGGIFDNNAIFSGSNHILDNVGWYNGNSKNILHTIKQKTPNALNLYDMSGNVWEWCIDYYAPQYTRGERKGLFSSERFPIKNPQGPLVGKKRVVRGGSYEDPDKYCWVFFRNKRDPLEKHCRTGFRLVIGI